MTREYHFCNAPTKYPETRVGDEWLPDWCSRLVRHDGDRCWQHKGKTTP